MQPSIETLAKLVPPLRDREELCSRVRVCGLFRLLACFLGQSSVAGNALSISFMGLQGSKPNREPERDSKTENTRKAGSAFDRFDSCTLAPPQIGSF